MKITRFNIRVYGILEHNNKILLVEETIGDFCFTKFSGGGLELGEGIRDCLIREFKEETGLDIEVEEHIYTTDFFQQSAFRENEQLIAIYYKVAARGEVNVRLDKHTVINNEQTEHFRFFWVDKNEINESILTFPTDKMVAGVLSD